MMAEGSNKSQVLQRSIINKQYGQLSYRANILSLNIYFKDLNYLKAELQPLYDLGDILSKNIGVLFSCV